MNDTEIVEQRWSRVKWTEVGQVASLLDGVAVDPAEARRSPNDWWRDRLGAGDLSLATRFLAMALPRLEAIGWAAEALERGGVFSPLERSALDATARWIQLPDDTTRRAAWAAADAVAEGPARFLGAAVFFSGGSIAPPDCGAVSPPAETCGVAVAATILGTAARVPSPEAFLREALRTGARIATGAAT